ncbi:hypothetical protein ACOMHN_060525 [Nucella lapillus]
MAGVVPVFIVNNQLPAFDHKSFTTSEIYSAVEKTSGFESVKGAQRIGSLWRIYTRTSEARQKVLLQGFAIRGVRVEVKDKNYFLVSSPVGQEKEVPATKLTISNVPLSFSDDDILHTIKKLNINVRSQLIQERDRDNNGKLTRWKTGRRFLYIDVPAEPLPKFVETGPFKATLYHKEQKYTTNQTGSSKCFEKGHQASTCTHPVKCRQCFKDGHKAGDPVCEMVPATQRENSNWQGKSSTCNRKSKSPVRDSASPTPNSDKTDKSPSQRSSKRKSSQNKAGKSPVRDSKLKSSQNRDGKSPVRDSASPAPNSDKTDKSPSQRSSKRKSSQNKAGTERRLQKSPISTRRTSSNGSLRSASRGRPLTRKDKAVRKGQKGQTVLNFPPKSSSSASGKRPRSVDATPPLQPDKYSRQHDSNEESVSEDDEEYSDVLSSQIHG